MGDRLTPEGSARSSSDLDLALFIALLFVATILRMWSLGDPAHFVFDETYYATEGCYYATGAVEGCQLAKPPLEVHPPLGKWLIGMGVKVFGFTPFGWRALPALAGGLSVGLLFLLARKLGLSVGAAAVAGAVLALDPLHFVQSRVAMLDIFVVTFGLGSLLALLKDRETVGAAGERSSGFRPWLLAAGALGGCAVASKWPGVFFLILLGILWWRFERRRGSSGRIALLAGIYLVLVPAVVYTATYVGRVSGPGEFVEQQSFMARTLPAVTDPHTYQSPAWSWPLIQRPVAYSFCAGPRCEPPQPDGTYEEIMATGNPFVWWPALLAVGLCAYGWVRRRDDIAAFVTLGFGVTYLPWLLPFSDRDVTYIFYMLPAVTFMALALGWALDRIPRERMQRLGLGIAGVLVVGSFVFYLPLLAKRPLDDASWKARLLVFDNCGLFAGEIGLPATGEAAERASTAAAGTQEAKPQTGWCWI